MIIIRDRYFQLNGRKFKAIPDWDLYKIIDSMEFGDSFFSGAGQFVPPDMLESIFAENFVFSPTFPESLPNDRLQKEWTRIVDQIEATDIDDSVAFLISRDLYMRIYEELNEIRPSDDPDEEYVPVAATRNRQQGPPSAGFFISIGGFYEFPISRRIQRRQTDIRSLFASRLAGKMRSLRRARLRAQTRGLLHG